MPRPLKWPPKTTRNLKLKLPVEIADKYANVLKAKDKTIQQDFEDHAYETIK